mgnify:FL=1
MSSITVPSEDQARVDPRTRRTRQLLIDAFLGLLAERRFEDITVQEIARRATINRATFYAHFADKYALIDELIGDSFAQMLRQRQAAASGAGGEDGGAREHLRALILAVCDHWQGPGGRGRCNGNHRLFEPLAEAQIKERLRSSVLDWLLRRHGSSGNGSSGNGSSGARLRHPRARLELTAQIVSWGVYGAASEWGRSGGTQSAEAFADEALPLLAGALSALDD